MAQSIAQQARGRLAAASVIGDPELVARCRAELQAAKLEQHIRQVVDAAPPLSPSQRERLALLLCPGLDAERSEQGTG